MGGLHANEKMEEFLPSILRIMAIACHDTHRHDGYGTVEDVYLSSESTSLNGTNPQMGTIFIVTPKEG